MACRLVQSLQVSVYFFISVLNNRAMSGTSGSSGFGSDIRAHIDNKTRKNREKLGKTTLILNVVII